MATSMGKGGGEVPASELSKLRSLDGRRSHGTGGRNRSAGGPVIRADQGITGSMWVRTPDSSTTPPIPRLVGEVRRITMPGSAEWPSSPPTLVPEARRSRRRRLEMADPIILRSVLSIMK